jgi:hydroxypyruvate reductase
VKDSPSDAAGAIADGKTISRASKKNLDPMLSLKNNDSYHFFDALNDLIKTGSMHTDVMDLRMMLVGETDT